MYSNKISKKIKLILFAFIFFILIPLICYSSRIPILNPEDPEFFWMDELIEKDFAKETKSIYLIDYIKSFELLKKEYPKDWIVRFRVVDNKVYGPPCGCRNMLEYLCDIYGLPDVDFIYYNQDGAHDSLPGNVPVLMGCRSNGVKNTLLFSDWLFDTPLQA